MHFNGYVLWLTGNFKGYIYQVSYDPRSYGCNFLQLRREAWKIQDFELVTLR